MKENELKKIAEGLIDTFDYAGEESKKLYDDYFNILDDIFSKISKFESGDKDIKNFLKYPTSISGIRETKINYKA